MNPILSYSMLIRFLLTPTLYLTRNNIIYTILLLFILDIIDCNPLIIKFFSKEFIKNKYCSLDKTYELLDKVLDIFQSFIAILFLKNKLQKHIYFSLLFFLIYRLIGIIIYYVTNRNESYVLFFDFIKEYLILYVLFNDKIPINYLIITIFLKIFYEYLMHRKHIFLTIYQLLFE